MYVVCKMNTVERATLHRCFEKTKELFSTHKHSESWSHNLIEGTRELSTPLQWKHMYVWLANPLGYDETKVSNMVVDPNPPRIDPYPDQMSVNTFQNGNETIIHVKNPIWYKSEDEKPPEDEEKTPE